MHDLALESARAAAEDVIDVLGAYELELEALDPGDPGVAALRQAVGAALAQACRSILDRDALCGPAGRVRH